MAIESINREFEVFMRDMVKAQECVHENIESEFRRLIRVTVSSCATMYGFSAEEALKRLNSNGEIIEVPVVVPIQQKELEKAEKAEKVRLKELEKAEKVRLKEAQKLQKAEIQAFEKTEKLRRIAFENAKKTKLKALEKTEKANELSERNQMKEQDIASKAIEKAVDKDYRVQKLKAKKVVKTFKEAEPIVIRIGERKKLNINNICDYDSDASTVIMTDSEDEEPVVLFQNIPLIEELNSIRNIKVQKKLSPGVKLARQMLDI